MRKREEPYRNQSAAPTAPRRVPVIAPSPQFANANEAIAYREAVQAIPRAPGEELIDWLRRVSEHAQGTTVIAEG